MSGHLQHLVRGRLWLQVLIGMGTGIGTGLLLGPSVGWADPDTAVTIGNWLALPGEIFLGMIQMIVIPLIFASIVRGLASGEDPARLRRMGLFAVVYFVLTTVVAIGIGVGFAVLIRPGEFLPVGTVDTVGGAAAAEGAVAGGTLPGIGAVPDLIAGLLPRNPLGSMVEYEMLQVVIFAVIVGVALVSLAATQAKPLLDLFGSIQQVCMTVVGWAMRIAPVAVFGLMARLASKTGLDILAGVSVYIATVLVGLLALVGFYLVLVRTVGGRRPVDFLRAVRDVQLLAFSTSSSAAVMPLSIRTAEEKLKLRPSVTQFVIPLGATINMDGTALYQGVATVFLAQAFGVELTLAGIVLLVVTAVAASIGAPAAPGVGIVILSMVLNAVGVPATGIALLIGVDRLLDMCRTAVNVTGDLTAATVMDRFLGGASVAVPGAGDHPVAVSR